MNGIEGSTYAAETAYAGSGIAPPPATEESELTRDSICASEQATAAMEALTETLNASGFVHIAGGVQVNFSMLVTDRPDESIDMEDLKPGVMTELVAWVAGVLEGDPETAQDGQARIHPQRAVSLLK